MLAPSRDEYLQRPNGSPHVAVHCDMLADMEAPLSAYWKLAHDEPSSFLLESVTGGEQVARYSIIGVRPREVFSAKGNQATVVRAGKRTQRTLEPCEDPLRLACSEVPSLSAAEVVGMPKLCGGAVGMVSYDYARSIERLPDSTTDDLNLADVAMMVADSVVVFDHAKNLIRVVVLADGSPEDYDRAEAEIRRVQERLREPLPALPTGSWPLHEVRANVTGETYQDGVRRVIEYIGQGDGIQMVPSLRFETHVDAHPLTVYRALRSLNPSPYMFLFRFGEFDIVGASPELLVSLSEGVARVRPIAGTRPRGATPEEDVQLEKDLLADEKERAEHIMLVDLGRNDLGRVCDYGSVHVNELMVIERYSHVMHIVSDVTGALREGSDSVDLFRACFPAGTVSGAPKVRAMQIIDEVETTRRGLYAGSVGYFSATGDMDMALAIRTILLKDDKAYVQAGAGIVFDSVPANEYRECANKARAALSAIEMAQKGLEGTR